MSTPRMEQRLAGAYRRTAQSTAGGGVFGRIVKLGTAEIGDEPSAECRSREEFCALCAVQLLHFKGPHRQLCVPSRIAVLPGPGGGR